MRAFGTLCPSVCVCMPHDPRVCLHPVPPAARHMAAYELSCDPYIAGRLRERYKSLACVNTGATDVGRAEIDPFHAAYGLHVLRRKPLHAFTRFEEPRVRRMYVRGCVRANVCVCERECLLEGL